MEEDRPLVLVIDDEIGPRESLRILLKNEYRVLTAESVDDGVKLLRERRPELVILDIRMPGKSGLVGLKEIRELDKQVSVVMLTGYGALETAQQAVRLGANDYLKKPFDTFHIQELVAGYVERTRIERRREAASRDLRRLNSELVQQLAEKEKMASIGQATAEFAHDFRNPLTIVNGYVQLLEQELNGIRESGAGNVSETREYLNVIEQNVQRCFELTHMWQQAASGDVLELTPVDVGEVIEQAARTVEPLAASAGVRLEYEPPAKDTTVEGNAGQLVRALHNLLANAVQACSGKSGLVRLAGRERGAEVLLEVQDNGRGMDSDQRQRMFDPFYTSGKGDQGTGLGMCIVQQVVLAHGGSIEVDSSPGKGTKVILAVPKKAPAEGHGGGLNGKLRS